MYQRGHAAIHAGHKFHLRGTTRQVLWLLVLRADADGYCWPSVRGMAADCRRSTSTVQQALYELEACGLIVADRVRGRHGTRYLLTLPSPPPQTGKRKRSAADEVADLLGKFTDDDWPQR